MTCQFPVDSLNMYRQRVLQDTTTSNLVFDHQLSLMSAAGSTLFRSAARAWVARGQQDDSSNDIALLEMEDDLLASFLLLAEDSSINRKRIALPADRALKDIEDYVCANLDTAITRDDLADKACVSIRSLSRAFEKNMDSVRWHSCVSAASMLAVGICGAQNGAKPRSARSQCRMDLNTWVNLPLLTKIRLANHPRQPC
jgi:hypothetical protein